MSNVIIISGPTESGKTPLIRELTNVPSKFWFDGRSELGAFDLQMLDENTKTIVIDDLTMKSGFWKFFTKHRWQIDRKGKPSIFIDPPDIIITTTLDFKCNDCNFSQIYSLSIYKIESCSIPELPF